jgi:DNA-directed RNA polymerase alpha subunit
MEYYNNKALEIIIKNQKATNENLFTLNNNQRNHTNSIFKLIEFNRSLIYDLKEENKSLREDLKEIKSVFNLDKQSTEDKEISSPSKEYQEMIDLLSKSINYLNLDNRPHNSIYRMEIKKIYDLVKLEEKQLKRFRWMGKKGINCVNDALSQHNLTLGMDISKYEPHLELNTK